MNADDDRDIDELIGRVMEDPVPAEVDRRLHAQLEEFRSALGKAGRPSARRANPLGRRVWWGAAAMAAAIAVAVAIGSSLHTRASFAEVAAAVLKQPWIHVADAGADGTTREFWYSPSRDISATREKDWIEYRDHRLRVYYWYDAKDGTLYRVPEQTPRRGDDLAAVVTALRVLLQSQQPLEKPLERLGFLRDEGAETQVLQQRLEKAEEGGRKWLDYHLTVRSGKLPSLITMLFRVDPETKLLHLTRSEVREDGKAMVRESRFDYPEKGPADVYDLGVPKTAKLVDRTPSNDVGRILETLKAGRQRMDNYRAFVIPRPDGVASTWWSAFEISYRKGDKFRRDFAMWKPAEMSRMAEEWPKMAKSENAEAIAAWWARQMDKIYSCPVCIVHGSTAHYEIRCRSVKAADGSDRAEVESVKKYPGMSAGPGDPFPPHNYLLPEFVCRPGLGIPHQWLEPVLELNPKDGPPGSILLRVRQTGHMPGAPGSLPQGVQDHYHYRFWLDPARDYAAVRWDALGGGEPGKEEILASTIIEEMAKSPQGTWYATRFRQESSARDPKGEKVADAIYYFYLDFKADLPDSLFEPPKPGTRVEAAR